MGQLYLIQVIGAVGGGSPDQGLPPMIGGGPVYPPAYPDQGLPGGGGLPPGIWPNPPGGGHRPDQGLPGGGSPGQPGHLPSYPPQIWPRPPGGGSPPSAGQLPGYHPDQGLPGGGQGPYPLPAYTQSQIGSPPAHVDDGKGSWVLIAVQGRTMWAWTQPPGDAEVEPPEGGGEKPDQGLPGGGDNSTPPPRPQPQPPEGSTKPNPVPTPQGMRAPPPPQRR
jgi:hypothetical protein